MKVFNNYLFRLIVPAIFVTVGILVNFTPKVQGDNQDDNNLTTIDFPGAVETAAAGINNRGDIVGGYITPDGKIHGFLLSNGSFTSIDFPPGNLNVTVALGINDRGDIVGFFQSPGVNRQGFLLRNGIFTSVEIPGSSSTTILDINDRGDLLGDYVDQCDRKFHGALLNGPDFTRIDFPGAISTFNHSVLDVPIGGINNRGDIAGYYQGAGNLATGNFHGFLLSRDSSNKSNLSGAISTSQSGSILLGPTVSFTQIDFPKELGGGRNTVASRINDRGDMVGYYDTANSDFNHGFLLSKGSFSKIDFPGAINTEPLGINERGDIVGLYALPSGFSPRHGFLLSGNQHSDGSDH